MSVNATFSIQWSATSLDHINPNHNRVREMLTNGMNIFCPWAETSSSSGKLVGTQTLRKPASPPTNAKEDAPSWIVPKGDHSNRTTGRYNNYHYYCYYYFYIKVGLFRCATPYGHPRNSCSIRKCSRDSLPTWTKHST